MTIRFYDDDDNYSLEIDQLEICDDKLKCSEIDIEAANNFMNANQNAPRFLNKDLKENNSNPVDELSIKYSVEVADDYERVSNAPTSNYFTESREIELESCSQSVFIKNYARFMRQVCDKMNHSNGTELNRIENGNGLWTSLCSNLNKILNWYNKRLF